MRFVSEQFKEIQDEIIRPALSRLTLEINTDFILITYTGPEKLYY